MFEPGEMLKKYLSSDPVQRDAIVISLVMNIYADPKFLTTDFEEAIDYVLHHGVNEKELFAEFREMPGDELNNSSLWTKKYYSVAIVNLQDNFCKDRIEHVRCVAKKLYATHESLSKLPEDNDFPQDFGKKFSKKLRNWGLNMKDKLNNFNLSLLFVVLVSFLVLLLSFFFDWGRLQRDWFS